jgi:hypothetical protein
LCEFLSCVKEKFVSKLRKKKFQSSGIWVRSPEDGGKKLLRNFGNTSRHGSILVPPWDYLISHFNIQQGHRLNFALTLNCLQFITHWYLQIQYFCNRSNIYNWTWYRNICLCFCLAVMLYLVQFSPHSVAQRHKFQLSV